jgi:hypothetical protein
MKFPKKPYSPYVKAGQLAYAETGTSMIAKLTSLTPTILTTALAVTFVVAGIINILGRYFGHKSEGTITRALFLLAAKEVAFAGLVQRS